MSHLPPALLARLSQRGLVQNKNATELHQNEVIEVIAEDYDELGNDEKHNAEEYQAPPQYDNEDITFRKRGDDNLWLERMRGRMGEANSFTGYKGCPNKYNVWHKCTLYCVNRWEDGKKEPSREYLKRYKRLLKKYPLPKFWQEMYDPGCGSFYFFSPAEELVSWLPPSHPKSKVTKSAATLRRRLEETGDLDEDSDEPNDTDENQKSDAKHFKEIDDILNAAMRPRSPNASKERKYDEDP